MRQADDATEGRAGFPETAAAAASQRRRPRRAAGREERIPGRVRAAGGSGAARRAPPSSRSRLPQRVGEVPRGLEALRRVLLEATRDEAVERGGNAGRALRGLRRMVPEDRGHRLAGRRPRERASPRQHLVEDGAEGEDVAAGVGGLAPDLLGRHVARPSQDDAGLGRRAASSAPTSGRSVRGDARPARGRSRGS